jgi:hypothetical protein
MVVLYIYGIYHFNTPNLEIIPKSKKDLFRVYDGTMLSLAPPRLTTSRNRFRSYSLRYIVILELLFVSMVFIWSAWVDTAKIFDWQLPNPPDLQYRALWAMFALTGLLSSFPYLKEIDAWLLQSLHRAALIPDSAALFAQTLYDSEFAPDSLTASNVRRLLTMRDTIRVAEGEAVGSLEQSILRTLWLKDALQRACSDERNYEFSTIVQRDLSDVDRISTNLIVQLRKLLRIQENCVPNNVHDIDEFISDGQDDTKLRDLLSERAALSEACNAVYFKMCLLTTMLVNSSKYTPETSSLAFKKIGFPVDIIRVPVWSWEAITSVNSWIFLSALGFQTLVITLYQLDLIPHSPDFKAPERVYYFIFSLITTIIYGIVIIIAISLKRHWSRCRATIDVNAQNLVICLVSYLAGGFIFLLLISTIPAPSGHVFDLTDRIRFAAGQLSLGVCGYFVGVYIDRSSKERKVSYALALQQAGIQFLAGLIASAYIIQPPHVQFSVAQSLAMATQSGLVGFVTGSLIQRFYRVQAPPSTDEGARASLIGDLKILTAKTIAH